MDSYLPNIKAGHALTDLASRYSESILVNSAVTGARRFEGAAASPTENPLPFHEDVAMESASSYESVGFFALKACTKLLAEFFGLRHYEKLDSGIAEDEIGWPSLREFSCPSISDSTNLAVVRVCAAAISDDQCCSISTVYLASSAAATAVFRGTNGTALRGSPAVRLRGHGHAS